MSDWDASSTEKGGADPSECLEWEDPDNDTNADLKKEAAVYQKLKEYQAGQKADLSCQSEASGESFAHLCESTSGAQTRCDNAASEEARALGAGVTAEDCIEVPSAEDFTLAQNL